MSKDRADDTSLAVSENGDPTLFEAFGVNDRNVQNYLLQLALGSFLPILAGEMSDEKKRMLIRQLIDSHRSMGPKDAVEGLLTSQMLSVHSATMECLRRAAIADQTPDARNRNLQNAQKLGSLYVKQLEALDRHRGKGQQKIVVEHVNVEAGGQAIVGNVEGEGRRPKKVRNNKPSRPVLSDQTGEAIDMQPVRIPLRSALGIKNGRNT